METAVAPESGVVTPPEPEKKKFAPLKGITRLTWQSDIPAQKWVNFHMKVLTKFASNYDMKLMLPVEISGSKDTSKQKMEEMKAALCELGLNDSYCHLRDG